MRVCYVPGKGRKQPFYAGRREGGKVVALYWPLLSPSFSHIQEDKKLERKLKNGMTRSVCGVCLGFLPFLAAILERVPVSPRKRAHQWHFLSLLKHKEAQEKKSKMMSLSTKSYPRQRLFSGRLGYHHI